MKTRVLKIVVPVCGIVLLFAGSAWTQPVITAKYAESPVVLDGKLDDPAWRNADVYSLSLGKDRARNNWKIQEGAEAMVSWDNENLYVGVKFFDSDVCTDVTEDQVAAFAQGDTLELFIKPDNETWYWELYATPNGKKTTYFLPGRGRILPNCFKDYVGGLRVAAQVQGTLNNWKDRDVSWTAEMAIPLKDITAYGDVFTPGAKWHILVARYNYSRYLSGWAELTMCPQLPQTSYHMYEYYATLRIVK